MTVHPTKEDLGYERHGTVFLQCGSSIEEAGGGSRRPRVACSRCLIVDVEDKALLRLRFVWHGLSRAVANRIVDSTDG